MKKSLAKQDKMGKSMSQEQRGLVKAHIALEDAQTKSDRDGEEKTDKGELCERHI